MFLEATQLSHTRIHTVMDIPLNTYLGSGEVQEVLDCDEVDERVTDIAAYQTVQASRRIQGRFSKHTILEVHAKIHEIDPPWTDLVDEVLEVPVRHLVRDILDHDRCPGINTALDRLNIKDILGTRNPLPPRDLVGVATRP